MTLVNPLDQNDVHGEHLLRRHRPHRRMVVIASPFESVVTLAIVVGFWLIVVGVFEILSAFALRPGVAAIR